MLINLLIILFLLLIIYQFVVAYLNNTIEGLENNEYKNYDSNNVIILAQQNAGNIQVLKQQIDKVLGLNKQVQDLSGNVTSLSEQVNNIILSQKQYTENSLPSSPPDITGATD